MTFIATQKTLKHSFGKVRTAKRIRFLINIFKLLE